MGRQFGIYCLGYNHLSRFQSLVDGLLRGVAAWGAGDENVQEDIGVYLGHQRPRSSTASALGTCPANSLSSPGVGGGGRSLPLLQPVISAFLHELQFIPWPQT
jgi:hypothetical protein